MDEKDRARYELSDQWVDRETEEYTIKEGGVEWLDRTLGIKGGAHTRNYITIYQWLSTIALVPYAEITRFTDSQKDAGLTVMFELANMEYTLDQLITEHGIKRAWAKEVLQALALYKQHYRYAPATAVPAAAPPPASPASVTTLPPRGEEEQGGVEEEDNESLPHSSTPTRGGGAAARASPGGAVKGKKPRAAASPVRGGSASKKGGASRKQAEAAASSGKGSADKKGARKAQAMGGGGGGGDGWSDDDFTGHADSFEDGDMEVEEEQPAQKPRTKAVSSRGKQSPSQVQRETRQPNHERRKVTAHRRQPRPPQDGGRGAGPSSLGKGGGGKGRAAKEGSGAARGSRPTMLDLTGGEGKGKKRACSSGSPARKDVKVKHEKRGGGGKRPSASMGQLVKQLSGEAEARAVTRVLEDMNSLLEGAGLVLLSVLASGAEVQEMVSSVMQAWRIASTSIDDDRLGVFQAALHLLESLIQGDHTGLLDTVGWKRLLVGLLKREGLGSLMCIALRDADGGSAALPTAVLDLAWRVTLEYGDFGHDYLRTLGKTTATSGPDASGEGGEGEGTTDEEGSDVEGSDAERGDDEEGDGELRFLSHVHVTLDKFVDRKDSHVVALALETLAQLTIDRRNTLELGKGLCKSVVRAIGISAFSKDISILTPACSLIQNLAVEGAELQEALVRGGAVSSVVAAYHVAQGKPKGSHSKAEDWAERRETLETRCAGALTTLCNANVEVQQLSGVVEVALACCDMVAEGRGRAVHHDPRTHLESVTAGLVSNLAAGHPGNQKRLGEGKACQAVVYIARSYRNDPLLLEDTCNAIWHLSMCPENRSKLVAVKGLEITIDLIKEAVRSPQDEKRALLEPSCDSFRNLASMDRMVLENRQQTVLSDQVINDLYRLLKSSLTPEHRPILTPEQQAAAMGAAMALAGWSTGADFWANVEDRKLLLKVLAKKQVDELAGDWDAVTFHLITYCMGLLERTTFATDVQGSARRGEVPKWWLRKGMFKKLSIIIQRALVKSEEAASRELIDARDLCLRQGLRTLWRLSSYVEAWGESSYLSATSARGQQLASEIEGEKTTLCAHLVHILTLGVGGDARRGDREQAQEELVNLALDCCYNLLNLSTYQAYLVRSDAGAPNLCEVLGDVAAYYESGPGEVPPEVGVGYKVLGPMHAVASYTDARTRQALTDKYIPEWWVHVLERMPPERSAHIGRALKGLRNYVTVPQLEEGQEDRYRADVEAYKVALHKVRHTRHGDAVQQVLRCLKHKGGWPLLDPGEDVESHGAVFLMNLADGELHRHLLDPQVVDQLEQSYASTQEELGELGGCALVCSLLRRAQGKEGRQYADRDRRAALMGLLMNLVSRSHANRSRLSGACKLVVDMLHALPSTLRCEDAEMLEWGLYVLAYLCTDHAANADRCRDLGAVELAQTMTSRGRDKGPWSDVRTAAKKVLEVLGGEEEGSGEQKEGDKDEEAAGEPDKDREEEEEGQAGGGEEREEDVEGVRALACEETENEAEEDAEKEGGEEAEAGSGAGNEGDGTTGTSTEEDMMQEGEEEQSSDEPLKGKDHTESTDSDKRGSEVAVAREEEGGQEEGGDQSAAGSEVVETGGSVRTNDKEAASEAELEGAGGATGKRGREEENPVPGAEGDEMQPAEKLPRTEAESECIV